MKRLKKLIKIGFWGKYLISCYHCVMCKLSPMFVSDEKAVKRYFKKTMGKELDLKDPQTFNEKVNWSKLYNRLPLMQRCADKVDVRGYVEEKG